MQEDWLTARRRKRSRLAALLLANVICVASASSQSPMQPPETVMNHVTGSLIALSTPDVAATAKWYQEQLGFKPVKSGEMGKDLRFALLRYDDNILELIQNPHAKPLAQAVPGLKDPFEVYGVFKLGFTVRNLDEVLGSLKERGVRVEFNTTQLNDLQLRAFGIRDLDGNLIQFFGK